ncbi:ergosterol biosynthetic protein 28 homolog [Ptychodera flava]|uniref:ergosterol biosynthetic protein 28 homolog n=1 Tax=Ptychodera flava TaxID=63121 RepID=UPI003969F3D2
MAVSMERVLRGWICLVAVMAFGSTIQCFVSQSVPGRLYTVQPKYVNPLMSRLFGVWTLLAAFVRFFGAVHITCKPIYNLTLVSFIIAMVHFLLEVFVYKTAAFEIGVITPILIAGGSVILMLIGYNYVEFDVPSRPHAKKLQ